MTSKTRSRPWSNDYGDIPRWYWGPAFRDLQISCRRGRRQGARARAVLASVLALAGGCA